MTLKDVSDLRFKLEDEDDVEILDMLVSSFKNYIKIVIESENVIRIARFRLDQQDFIKSVENMDRSRRMVHDTCISNMKMVNRMCKSLNLDKLFTDEEIEMDRRVIADEIILPFGREVNYTSRF